MVQTLSQRQESLYHDFINGEEEFDDIEFSLLFRSLAEGKYRKMTLEQLQEVIVLTGRWMDENKPLELSRAF